MLVGLASGFFPFASSSGFCHSCSGKSLTEDAVFGVVETFST